MWSDFIGVMEGIPALSQIISIVLTLIFGLIIKRFACHLVDKTFNNRLSQLGQNTPRRLTLNHLINSVIKYVVAFIVIIIILGQLGINVASILAAAGVVGLAVSFGAQALVKDIFTGFFIILEDQYNVGEYVSINKHLGIVEEVGMRVTKIKGFDGELYIIPNGSIVDVANYCRDNMRVVIDQNISYDSDIDLAETIMKESAAIYYAAHQEDIVEPPMVVGVQALMESSITMRLICYTLPMKQWDVERGLRKTVKMALDKAGIKIPFPVCEIVQERSQDGIKGEAE
ncbi:MAG: mechanosensitive ion channel family protein [Clostridiales bacterium]